MSINSPSPDFSRRQRLTRLMALALPAIAEQFLMTLVNYVDTAMVGSLGANATAAIAVTASSTWLIGGVLSAAGVGFSVQVAYAVGAKDTEQVKKIIRQALLLALLIGLSVMTICLSISYQLPVWLGAAEEILADARSYIRIYMMAIPFNCINGTFSAILRCMGDTKTPMRLNTGSNLLNVVLNFFFIFPTRQVHLLSLSVRMPGLGLGVTGAAIASAISMASVGIILLLIIFRRKSPYRIRLTESYRPDRAVIGRAVRLGIPVLLERVLMSGGQVFMTRMVSGLGTVALAANHVAVTAEGISYMPAFGVSFAATTLVGQSLGAKDQSGAVYYGKLSGWVGFLMSTFMGAILFAFSVPLSTIFSSDPQVIALSARMLRLVAFAEPMFGVSIVLSGALRGAGDTRYPLFVSMFCMIGLRCVLAPIFIFVIHMDLAAVWLAMDIDLIARGILCIWRFKSGKYLKYADRLGKSNTREF